MVNRAFADPRLHRLLAAQLGFVPSFSGAGFSEAEQAQGTSTSGSSTSSKGLSGNGVAGVVIAVLIVVGLAIVGGFLHWRHRKAKNASSASDHPTQTDTEMSSLTTADDHMRAEADA